MRGSRKHPESYVLGYQPPLYAKLSRCASTTAGFAQRRVLAIESSFPLQMTGFCGGDGGERLRIGCFVVLVCGEHDGHRGGTVALMCQRQVRGVDRMAQ